MILIESPSNNLLNSNHYRDSTLNSSLSHYSALSPGVRPSPRWYSKIYIHSPFGKVSSLTCGNGDSVLKSTVGWMRNDFLLSLLIFSKLSSWNESARKWY